MQNNAQKIRAMNSCVVCKKYSAFCGSDGVCEKCASLRPTTIHFVEKKGMMPVKIDGYILSEDDWYRLQSQVNKFYSSYDPEWINDQNKENREIRRWKELPRNSPGVPGYIYLLKASNGFFKIGRAANVEKRLNNHKRMYPLEIEVLHTVYVADTVRTESYLLKRFEDYKLQGEWFLLEREHVDFICQLTTDKLNQIVTETSGASQRTTRSTT
jgi:hypothetical protein